MEFNEILAELTKFENTDDYKNFVAGLMNDDRINAYLETENGKKALQPRLDSHFTKSLKTWQDNNLSGLVDAEVKKRYPDADPKDVELNSIKAQLEALKAANIRKDLQIKAHTIATEKKLPLDLVDYFIGADEKSTIDNLNKLTDVYTSSIAAAVDEKIKGASHVPPEGDDKPPMDGVEAAFFALNPNLRTAD